MRGKGGRGDDAGNLEFKRVLILSGQCNGDKLARPLLPAFYLLLRASAPFFFSLLGSLRFQRLFSCSALLCSAPSSSLGTSLVAQAKNTIIILITVFESFFGSVLCCAVLCGAVYCWVWSGLIWLLTRSPPSDSLIWDDASCWVRHLYLYLSVPGGSEVLDLLL